MATILKNYQYQRVDSKRQMDYIRQYHHAFSKKLCLGKKGEKNGGKWERKLVIFAPLKVNDTWKASLCHLAYFRV